MESATIMTKDVDIYFEAKYLVLAGSKIYPFNDKKKAIERKETMKKRYGKYGFVRLYKLDNLEENFFNNLSKFDKVLDTNN